jgi:hypothetical protein
MMTFALTLSAQMQAQNDGLDDIMAEMIAAKDSHYYIANLQSVDVVYVDEGSIINGTYVSNKAHVYMPLEKE